MKLRKSTFSLVVFGVFISLVYSEAVSNSTHVKHAYVQYDSELDVIYYEGKVFINQQSIRDSSDPQLSRGLSMDNPPELLLETGEVVDGDRRYPPGSYEFYYWLWVAIALTLGAGVMSGLTVGYLSIDSLELEMKLQNGTDDEKRQALAVLPVLEDHHYLLVTLLLANALWMEALPIYLDAIVPSAYAILISVVAVLFFGEVIPQAICTGPQQIKIGACLAPLIQLLKIALGIISYPIAKALDMILGEHMATRYSNSDLKALIELHSYHALEAIDKFNTEHAIERGLKPYQTKMINSVIDLRVGTVRKIMIPFSQIFSLKISKKIDNRVAKKIMKAGFSRIPVYEKNDKHRIVGIMLIKTLIGVDLSEGKSIWQLVNEGEVVLRKPQIISPNEKIEDVLAQFKLGKSHMAIVTEEPEKMQSYINCLEDIAGDLSVLHEDDENNEGESSRNHSKDRPEPAQVLGLITLEDLIEYIIKEDILDEADYDRDMRLNRDPYMRVDRSFLLDNSNISQFLLENREKIKDIVENQVQNCIDKRTKFKFRPEYAKSIIIKGNDLSVPLIDKSENCSSAKLKVYKEDKT